MIGAGTKISYKGWSRNSLNSNDLKDFIFHNRGILGVKNPWAQRAHFLS